MKKINVFVVLAISVILMLIAIPAVAAPSADNPGKGHPEFEKLVFIHYQNDFAKPGGVGNKADPLYSYSRYHWPTNNISYAINTDGSPAGVDVITGITASFQIWQNDPNSNVVFNYLGATTTLPGLNAITPDYQDVVGFADLSYIYPDAIGVTISWATRGSKLMVDCDTVLNTASEFAWTQNTIATDPDTELIPDTAAYDMDIQAIMTHEAGHWLVLNDLYNTTAMEQTMYGYASDRELKKRSLESGDLAGIKKIYP